MASGLSWGILAQSLGPRVRLLRNVLSARSIAVSARHGLPTGSLTALALIAANPGSSQGALARRAGLSKSALVGLVDQLEQRGLIHRDRAANDRRRYRLSVTAEGERLMHELFALVTHGEAGIRDALSPEDMATLLALTDRAIAALDDDRWRESLD